MPPEYSRLSICAAEVCHQVYRYADVSVASAWPLVELPRIEPLSSTGLDITIGPRATPAQEPADSEWVHHWPDESGAMSLGRYGEGNDFLLRFPDLADFVISEDGRAVRAWPAEETNADTLRHLLLDQVLPRALAHQGRLVLHAGAVRVGREAIAFIGETGMGKSTLTASFHAAGYPLLSDDGLVLMQGDGTTLAQPTYPSLRLWPESVASLFARPPDLAPMAHYSSKQRVTLTDTVDNTPVSLAAIYVLAPEIQKDAASISLTTVSPSEACMAIISNSFQLDVTDRPRAMSLLTVASHIAQQLPVFSLVFQRSFASLPDVREAILKQHCQKTTADR